MKRKNTNQNSLLAAIMFLGFLFLSYCIAPFSANELSYYEPLEIIMDCSQSDPSSYFRSTSAKKLGFNFSAVSRVSALDPHNIEEPKSSACIFKKRSTNPFYVSNGPKFIRLYFKPTTYSGLKISKALFSVSVGQYTLLTTSESSYSKLNSDVDYVIREFCINIVDQLLNVIFTPSSKISGAYAFFNKIEIVSMPSKLYIQESLPLPLVGYPSHYSMDNSTALEMMHRLNVGGDLILQPKDSMFRLWTRDVYYLKSGKGKTSILESEVEIKSSSLMPAYTAPVQVYTSARTFLDMPTGKHTAEWSFPVDSGFYYLVRLHFCEISHVIRKEGKRVFHVYINNATAEDHADIFHWSHGVGIPIYKDYIVDFSRHGEGIQYLSISMRSINESLAGPILNGLEIFKLSDPSNNLAGAHPFGIYLNFSGFVDDAKDHVMIISWSVHVLLWSFIAISFLCFIMSPGSTSLRHHIENSKQGRSPDLYRIFSVTEIKLATNSFSDSLLIGTGGFGTVYKGSIDGTTIAAIKRANPSSRQGLKEFQTEISVLSKLRHCHLVSLIGYSVEDNEMILVYDYMAQGTLRDHLYKTKKPPLPWKQRLKICIEVARGVHYLHTGAKNTIIHRDIKSTNILLDDKLVAKVSDFGLSKLGPSAMAQSKTHVSTIVKGTFGYLDPEYYRRQKLTEKSDVYSFGVVLFETLCARPAVIPMGETGEEEYEKVNLAEWALHCYQMGTLDQIIDPYLKGKIAPECFKTFTDIARKCLADRGSERPSMGDVLCNLELAMKQQNAADLQEDMTRKDANRRMNGDVSIIINGVQCNQFDNSDQTPGVEFSEIMVPLGR